MMFKETKDGQTYSCIHKTINQSGICDDCFNKDDQLGYFTTQPQNDWRYTLHTYFRKNNALAGEHWIEGMIRIVEGLLSDQETRIRKEIVEDQLCYNMSTQPQNNWKEAVGELILNTSLSPFEKVALAFSMNDILEVHIRLLLSSQAHALKEQMKGLITQEIANAQIDGIKTSQLTSLYNNVSVIESIEI